MSELFPGGCIHSHEGASIFLTFSAQQTTIGTFANSVDSDEMAHHEPAHLDLHGLPFCSCFFYQYPVYIDGYAHNQKWKIPL